MRGVAARSGQRHAQRAGHRTFRPAGIRRTMFCGIAFYHPQRRADRSPGDRRRDREQQGRQSRRHQIDEIVKPRRGPAKRGVALAAMPDHGVGGVDCLVGDQSRQPQQRQPEHRRHHAVGKILGAGFDRRPADAGFVQLFGIAPDDPGHGLLCAGEAAFGECRTHPGDMLIEASLRDENRGDQRDDPIAHWKLLHDRLNQNAHGCR